MKNEFDKFANDYREIHTENVQKVSGADSDYFTEYKIAEISRFMSDGKVWLDFGCGDGNSARFILRYFPQSQYYGVDVSGESIEAAKKGIYPVLTLNVMMEINFRLRKIHLMLFLLPVYYIIFRLNCVINF